jgi:cytochrome P450
MSTSASPRRDPDPSKPSARLVLLDAIAAMDVPFANQTIAGRPVVFINEPALIAEVLGARAASFEKSEFQRRVMGMAEGSTTGLGNGLLTSSNAVNKHQRKLLGRVFSPAATARYVHQIAALTRRERDRWVDGVALELGDAFMRLSTRIVGQTLFSWELAPGDDRIVESLAMIGNLLGRSAKERNAGWEDPSAIERCALDIEGRLLSLVAERRARGGDPDSDGADVIDLLLAAQSAMADASPGAEDAYVVDDRQIRDEVLTLFITGAENPRNALTWTLHLLARHPEAAERIREEVHAAGAASGDITPETLARLPFTLQVYKEALRLYPPGYAFGRRATEDVRVGEMDLERGTEVVVSPYALHRRPGLFERPHEFDPDRFDKRREGQRHPYAYLPFGAGPRSCIGGGFALLEGHVVLAVLLGSLRFTPTSNAPLLPDPRMTLRPNGPVWMIAHRDEPGA